MIDNRSHLDGTRFCPGAFRRPLECGVKVGDVDEVESAELFLGFGEWSVRVQHPAVAQADGRRGVSGLELVAAAQRARGGQFFRVGHVRGIYFLQA